MSGACENIATYNIRGDVDTAPHTSIVYEKTSDKQRDAQINDSLRGGLPMISNMYGAADH